MPSTEDYDEDPRVTRTRQLVHTTVLRLLESEGPEAVIHSRVVDESGVSRATVYRHWPDRTSLLENALASERPQFDVGAPTGDFRVDLTTYMRAGAKALNERRTVPWLLALSMRANHEPEYQVVLDRLLELHDTPLEPLYRVAAEQGYLRPDVTSEMFQAMCFGTLFAMRFIWQRPLDDDLVDEAVDSIMRGVAS